MVWVQRYELLALELVLLKLAVNLSANSELNIFLQIWDCLKSYQLLEEL